MDQNIAIRCPIHRRELVVTGCINPNCSRQPLICTLCPDAHQDHYSNIVQISEWLSKVSKTIQEGTKTLKQIKDINQIDSVLKWCEDNEMHLRKVEEHCKAQKALINEDINYLKDLLNEKCNQAQAQLEQDLEDFYIKYKEQFKICKLIMDDSYVLQKQCNPYGNVHNLIMKLQQSTAKEAQDLTGQFRKLINKCQDPIESIRQCAESITEMTINLPVFAFQDGIDAVVNQLAEQIQIHFKSKLNITLPRQNISPLKYQPKNLHKQYSLPTENNNTNNYNSNQQQNIAKSPRLNQKLTFSPQNSVALHSKSIVGQCSDLNLKPLKKYQLDFSVSSVEVVTPQIFAMTCSNDPHLRVFDTVQKRIHTLSAHSTPIISMQKSIEQLSPLQMHNNQKPQAYLFTMSNDMLIVWSFDFSNPQMMIPHIFHKYQFTNSIISQCCYLQDNACIALGDQGGAVEVYNFSNQRVQQNAIKGKHNKMISSILLLKKYDKFICSSYDQSLSIWKMLYSSQQFENAYCESIIQCGNMLGQIQIINQFQQNPNLLLVGNLEGSLKIVNIINQCVVLESENCKNNNSICDFIIAEDVSKESICVVTYLQSCKSLRFWRLQNTELGWSQSEQRIEVALSLSDNMVRSKLQIVSMPSSTANTVVLIANEVNKELLVYEMIAKA